MNKEEKKATENLKKNRGVSFKEADVLSNLIEKQQKDIENLKKVVNVEKVMCENMIGDVEIVCMYKDQFLRDYGDDYISKSKIQETIKDLEKHIIMNSDKFAIQVLKDLLKENNNE